MKIIKRKVSEVPVFEVDHRTAAEREEYPPEGSERCHLSLVGLSEVCIVLIV